LGDIASPGSAYFTLDCNKSRKDQKLLLKAANFGVCQSPRCKAWEEEEWMDNFHHHCFEVSKEYRNMSINNTFAWTMEESQLVLETEDVDNLRLLYYVTEQQCKY